VSHAYIKQNKNKAKYLGFVTFSNEKTAEKCLKARIVRISHSETLTIKKFTAKSKGGISYPFFQNKSPQDSQINNIDTALKEKNDNRSHNFTERDEITRHYFKYNPRITD
jgi:hypothetical protein